MNLQQIKDAHAQGLKMHVDGKNIVRGDGGIYKYTMSNGANGGCQLSAGAFYIEGIGFSRINDGFDYNVKLEA